MVFQYPNYDISVYKDGWPINPKVLNGASTVVVYADGGPNHPLMKHLSEFDELHKNGTALVCIHYAVEIPKGNPGNKLVDWTGGYFETDWSVNPHWTAEYKNFPDHIITRGVKPFQIHDEWYYNMRFREQMEGVQPILSAIPPKSTLSRPDGPHSGNPHVRAMAGQPQHVAWASENSKGVRGFGFTGGHFHWNWGNDNFRKLILNAIVWSAHGEVPTRGVPSKSLTVADLEENQDYEKSSGYNPIRIQKHLEQWNSH